MFWFYDSYHDGHGTGAWKRRWSGTLLAGSAIIAGLFICVAGLYVNIKAIVDAYVSKLVIRTVLVVSHWLTSAAFYLGHRSYYSAV